MAASRPRLQHTGSNHSIAAEEEYFSLDDGTSSVVRSDDPHASRATVQRYSTPPSAFRTPANSNDMLQQEVTELPRRRATLVATGAAPNTVSFDERPITIVRKPVPSHSSSNHTTPERNPMDPAASPSTTPGVDDTPYIRFAIDQLTRDEEVRRETRQYVPAVQDDYPVDRIIPDEGLGYIQHEQAPTPPPPPRVPRKNWRRSMSPIGRDVFEPFHPPRESLPYPPLEFVPGILRPVWLGLFLFLCLLMLTGLLFCAIWSPGHDGFWDYDMFGGGRYFVFQYLPTMLGMILLLWLFQIQKAVQRISPFMALASDSPRARAEGVFLNIYPTHFLLPNLQHFRAGQPMLGVCSIIFWLFLFTIPLLASTFNVRFFGPPFVGQWRWVAVQGVIWTVIVLYILLIVAIILLFVSLRRKTTGLKWDPRSLADIIVLLERSNVMTAYNGSETFASAQEFRDRLQKRSDRLGYWHTSKRPQDIFYGLGEEGGTTRRYSIEAGRIREKAPERQYPPTSAGSEASAPHGGDFSIRMDIRSSRVRARYLPWFLKDTFVVAWLVIAIVLLIAWLVVSFVNRAVNGGFYPLVPVAANSGGFSASNFLYSFLPATIAMLLFLLYQPLDLAYRRLAPFAALSQPGGTTAEKSLLVDYPARLPVSVTIAAASNGGYQVALLSFISLLSATFPVLAGGCFWTQFYVSDVEVRVAAHSPAYYALCVFLCLYAVSLLVLLVPGGYRKRMALPHDSRSLAELISWVYQSELLTDRAFARVGTRAEMVARLVGHEVALHQQQQREQGGLPSPKANGRTSPWASFVNLVGGPKRNLAGSEKAELEAGRTAESERLNPSTVAENPFSDPTDRTPEASSAPVQHPSMADEKRRLRTEYQPSGPTRYGFGIYVGRDGREHLGIDRMRRPGRGELVLHDFGKRGRRESGVV
ncbi:hypothetical protein H2201_006681 [Coniosporium apollinis]|uniref:Phosphoribosylaminoimidazole-succinocarboxamide synthase n=1 Tax=Coniosporium apollinis TaxID=61459 RepID=A0ABQ9NL29_9PEZI|nr:hypothetical protein H2201_006681 [Coniosporium apollinis]